MLGDYKDNLADSYIDYRILDDSGHQITGIDQPKGEPVAADSAGRYFPGWRIELYFRGSEVYEKAASERIAVYIWTGLLVISLILVSGAFAAKAVIGQVKLNRLKNDFIATVSHELKTPLASMRVLVDTLLEGNYTNQQQALEYLQLISTENIRLSRLIDNFLTFSRMERNKRAFQLMTTDPAQIAHAAADAVKTKLNNGHCRFTVDIQQDLPVVYADHDAMVTVIVNLLDNAYKYSYDDKRIELRVLAENGFVVFRVTDNGLGLSRRSLKKIFKRFYQVDRSLSRRTGGCGLGLSIAKFIVDAHKGKVTVESKPGQGSTFTVKIPLRPKHAD
jgi:signal transduction histidine kinase